MPSILIHIHIIHGYFIATLLFGVSWMVLAAQVLDCAFVFGVLCKVFNLRVDSRYKIFFWNNIPIGWSVFRVSKIQVEAINDIIIQIRRLKDPLAQK